MRTSTRRNKGHGRIEVRRIATTTWLNEYLAWPQVGQVFRLERERRVKGKTTTEVAYGITSLSRSEADAERLLDLTRAHWRIENGLHWVLDVTFREDDSRVRDRTAARNFALLRKIALNLVARDRSTQTSLRGRRKKAAWNDGYMLQIIAHQAHA